MKTKKKLFICTLAIGALIIVNLSFTFFEKGVNTSLININKVFADSESWPWEYWAVWPTYEPYEVVWDDYSNFPPTFCKVTDYMEHWYYECEGEGSNECYDSTNEIFKFQIPDCWDI